MYNLHFLLRLRSFARKGFKSEMLRTFFFKIFLPLQLKEFAIAVPPFVRISVLIIFNMF